MQAVLQQRNSSRQAVSRFAWLLAVCWLFELGSWFGWEYPVLGSVLALIIALGWLVVVSRDVVLAVVVLLAELMLGSQGYLYSFRLGETVLSLRFLLFVVAFGYILWRAIHERRVPGLTQPWRWWYVAALAAIGWGAAVGAFHGNGFGNVFLDMNGYLYLGLFPLYLWAAREPNAIQRAVVVVTPVLVWLTLKTFLALYLFSHVQPEALIGFYQWWRQTGFGEITFVSGSLYRIFAQSQVYAVAAAAVGFAWLWRLLGTNFTLRRSLPLLTFLWLMLAVTVASLSRSFWLGLALAWVLVPLARGFSFKRAAAYVLTSVVLVLAAAGTVLVVTSLPWPLAPVGANSAEAFAKRLGAGEAASESRLRLLTPLWQAVTQAPVTGKGFGSTVTYFSTDPRIVKSTAGGSGEVTTYAFEWGYLDAWLKFGLLGLVAFFAFICRGLVLNWRAWFTTRAAPAAGVFALIALMGLNATTPYLNHPLGLGLVMAILACAALPV